VPGTPPPATSVVLVDLGGVAARFQPSVRLTALARASGLDEAEVRARIWEQGLDARMDRGELDLPAAHRAVCAALERALPLDEVSRLWALAFEPDQEVLELIDAAGARARLALLSDNGPLLRHGLARWLPAIHRRFAPCLLSCELGATKPSPECYARALARLAARADRVLLLDDSPANVEGAREAGLRAERCASAQGVVRALAAHGLLC
jgi:HAD superfamily hydrolase (TIGR01509 family)